MRSSGYKMLPTGTGWIGVLSILLCWFGMLPAQKSSTRSDSLEVNTIAGDQEYRTEYGKVDRASGVIRYIYQEKHNTGRLTPQAITEKYLQSQADRFGISSVQQDLQLTREVQSPGGHHLTYTQRIQGIPVYNSGITVTLDNQGSVTFVSSTYRPHLVVNNIHPGITVNHALQIAEGYLHCENAISGTPNAEMMILKREDNMGLLVYRVQIVVLDPRGDWEVLVDAGDSRIRQARNLLRFQNPAAGQGLIWDPDPLTSAHVYYGGSFIDDNDADAPVLNAQRRPVILNDLKHADGKYYLDGPYARLVDIDTSIPDIFPALSDSNEFNFTRNQQEFEDVMVYYNLDRAGRHLNDLGFNIDGLLAFRADPHGFKDEDNSYYSPFGNYCVFGEGGVDDAEDADVLWHEYAHAIMQNIQPGMTYEGETAAIEEGSADYWAASNSRAISDFAWGQLYIWDAGIDSSPEHHGTFWSGRRCDLNRHYPEDYDFTATKGHDNGQIWSSALMHIWSDLGRTITDRLFVQAIYLWGTAPAFRDAAQAFIQADRLLYTGQHLADISYWFDYHGLIERQQIFPLIVHEPLADSENLNGPYPVRVQITPATAPLDVNNLRVIWGFNGTFIDSRPLKATAEQNVYATQIPGTGQIATITYYITAADSANYFITSPGHAPVEYYSFKVGPDIQAPLLVHKPLSNQSYRRWPPAVNVYATDNVGIERVMVYYYLNHALMPDSLPLSPAQVSGWFRGYFGLDTNQVAIGDTVHYKILVQDNSLALNRTMAPPQGYYSFAVIAGGGEMVFDFEADNDGFTGQGDWQWGLPGSGPRSAFSGERAWATNLNGNYSNGSLLSSLVSPPIDLRGFKVARLEFWQWYDIRTPGDGGNIKISVNEGQDWQVLQPLYGYDGALDSLNGMPMAGEDVFCGRSPGWIKTYCNLDTCVDKMVQLKFDFGADTAWTGLGWYIDSLAIREESLKLPPPGNLTVLDNRNVIKLGWEYFSNFKSGSESRSTFKELPGQVDNNLISSVKVNFRLYRRVESQDFKLIGQTPQHTFTDSIVSTGLSYDYYLITQAGSMESAPSDTVRAMVDLVIGIKKETGIPRVYALQQNYPNPFNPITTIQFQLPVSCRVRLTVYDITGRMVTVVVNEKRPAGYHQVEFNAAGLSSGIYFYRIETEKYTQTKKMVLLR
jgi:Zn-dependent metalloprotease